MPDMANTREHSKPARRRGDHAGSGQPESIAALRPSQRRAAVNRAARREQGSAGTWLRRLTRP